MNIRPKRMKTDARWRESGRLKEGFRRRTVKISKKRTEVDAKGPEVLGDRPRIQKCMDPNNLLKPLDFRLLEGPQVIIHNG